MKKILLLMVAMLLIVSGAAFAGVVGSMHDLTLATGTGSLSTGTALSACEYCHTPHNPVTAAAPLWNKTLTDGLSYTMYVLTNDGGTIAALPGSASLTCLTCHDGTLDVGDTISNGVELIGSVAGVYLIDGGTAALTTNTTHPIGVTMTDGRAYIAAPAEAVQANGDVLVGGGSLKIYGGGLGVGTVECASCHNPHSNTVGTPFLKAARTTICTDCHNEGI